MPESKVALGCDKQWSHHSSASGDWMDGQERERGPSEGGANMWAQHNASCMFDVVMKKQLWQKQNLKVGLAASS